MKTDVIDRVGFSFSFLVKLSLLVGLLGAGAWRQQSATPPPTHYASAPRAALDAPWVRSSGTPLAAPAPVAPPSASYPRQHPVVPPTALTLVGW